MRKPPGLAWRGGFCYHERGEMVAVLRSPTDWGKLARQAEESERRLHALCARLNEEMKKQLRFGHEVCVLRRDHDIAYEMYLEQRAAGREFRRRETLQNGA